MDMVLRQLNPHACRTYLLGMKGSNKIVLIDPVLEHVNDYLELLDREKLKLTCVVDTHTHADHISGAAVLKDHTGCAYGMHPNAPSRCVSMRITEDFEGSLGDIPVRVIYTPGHTRDSISLVLSDGILTGDVLFLDDGGAGRDDLPGGDPGEHWESLQRIRALPDRLIVYPAHEYRNRQPSPLGRQKEHNPHLRPHTKEEYIQYVEDLKLGPADWMKDVLKANYACARDPKAAWIPVDVPACEVKGTLAQGVNDQQVRSLSVEELQHRLGTGSAPVLLDVREAKELEGPLGHLPGIQHIPIGHLSTRLSELELYRDRDIVIICRSGGRAHTATQILMQAGFRQVQVLERGMMAWREAGYPVEKTHNTQLM